MGQGAYGTVYLCSVVGEYSLRVRSNVHNAKFSNLYTPPYVTLFDHFVKQKNRAVTFEHLVIMEVQWCWRNSKSHFARNLLANRRTNLTLIVRLGTKGG